MGCSASSPAADGNAGGEAPRISNVPLVPRGQPQPCRFAEHYKMGAKLGAGGFAVVKVATHTATRYDYAVKIMTMPPTNAPVADGGATRKEILNEIEVLAKLEHATCLRMKEWYHESDRALIVMEYVRGGELLEALSHKGTYSEADARAVFRQLLDGLVYLHSLGIVHRDLKLENLMLSRAGSITEGLKIVDFGLARFGGPFDEDDMSGTPLYVAPEVVGAPGPAGTTGAAAVTVAVDVWAAGVILYMLLSGTAPFMHADDNALFSLIRKGVLRFSDPAWAPVSPAGKALISALVVVKPEGRLSAVAARSHAWFGADVPATPLAAAQSGLRKLAARRKFKGAIKGVVAARRLRSIIVAGGGGAAAAPAAPAPASDAARK